jgi:hypothetical protein
MRYRLIKPDWAKDGLIVGPNVIEDDNFSEAFLKGKNEQGYNIYYFPNHNSTPLDKPFLSGKDVNIFNYCFVDMDLKDGIYQSVETFVDLVLTESPKPNRVVFSGNGVHAYWEVANLSVESYVELQLRLIKKYKTDKSIWTVLQLMRLPGFYNTKDQNNFKFVEELKVHSDKYSVLDLKSVLPELNNEDKRKMETHLNKVKGLEEFADFDETEVEIPEKFIEMLNKSKVVQDLWGAEQGERSEADYKLAKVLFDLDYRRDEALAVIMNTNKALAKGAHKKSYALTVVGTAYANKAKNYVPSAAQMLRDGLLTKKRGTQVRGPAYLDCLYHGWRTGQLLGLIGSPGVGKTTTTLDMFYGMIKNNPQEDDIFIFFSLEMPASEIIEKWQNLTQGEDHLSEKLYVVSNESDGGEGKFLSLQDIYSYTKDISKVSGKKVKAIAIDHGGLINPTIDVSREPSFGLKGREDLGYGTKKTMSDRDKPTFVKALAKELDIFVILQSQTTKDKAGDGDVPLGLGAAFGASQYEQAMDFIITIWRPLKRVSHKSTLAVTAWQLCKNRHQHKLDKVKPFEPCVLFVDLDNGKFRDLTDLEFEQFLHLNGEATQLRKMSEKEKGVFYSHNGDFELSSANLEGEQDESHEVQDNNQ